MPSGFLKPVLLAALLLGATGPSLAATIRTQVPLRVAAYPTAVNPQIADAAPPRMHLGADTSLTTVNGQITAPAPLRRGPVMQALAQSGRDVCADVNRACRQPR